MKQSDFLTPRTQQDLRETIYMFLSMKSVGITSDRLTILCQREGEFEHKITAGTIIAAMQDFRREIAEHKAENPHLYPK